MAPRSLWATALAVAAATVLIVSGGANGDSTSVDAIGVQREIDAHLAAYPGGKQINATEISYDDGHFVMTFVRPPYSVAGTADCPAGWYCFYDGVDFAYPRGKLNDCGWKDLAVFGWNDRLESVHYNMSNGSTGFIDHGGQPNHSGDTDMFSADTSASVDSDVAPYRNMANHIDGLC